MDKHYKRSSILAPYIDGLIAEKRALGFSYHTNEYQLNNFDHYCTEKGLSDPAFDRDFLNDWMKRDHGEGNSNSNRKIGAVRVLSRYMNSLGIHSYIPIESLSEEKITPHFLSAEERVAFFQALEEMTPACPGGYAWRLWNEYRVFFRLVYACGLRNNEACTLRPENVDLEKKTITIIHSKGDKDRLVYPADDVCLMLDQYITYLTGNLGYLPSWVFPGQNPADHIPKTSMDRKFNEIWYRTPFAASCNKKPTVHSLRHSFVVDKINEWLEEGKNFDQMMLYLSQYLGHTGPDQSMYYYHLSEKANILLRRNDKTANRVIPEVKKFEY